MSRQLGSFIAQVARQAALEAVRDAYAGLWAFGQASSTPTADPDGSGRQVVDVTIGSVTWPALVIRTGETITNGDRVLVLMGGVEHTSGWLVLKA